jgi:calcineurin-like phosphoesterase family protein
MRDWRLRLRHLGTFIALCLFLCAQTSAQTVRFVQITDPHLFDQGEEKENLRALESCIARLNDRIIERGQYDFAVITGDFGVESLVSKGKDANRASILESDTAKRERRIEEGATELATILAQSRIRVWLFLPGNNDLLNEEPDLQYYRLFIKFLKNKLIGMSVIDLCPEEPNNDSYQLGVFRVGALAFVGFNNASFKNNNKSERISRNKALQEEYVQQVIHRISANDISAAYIFYHIPELDDPYLVTGSDRETIDERKKYTDNPYLYSSWFVDKEVYRLWNEQVVQQSKVRGLFAGHYHDGNRETYTTHHWMKTANYLSGSLSKLFIAPPIAVKRQSDLTSQARGFQEVAVDGIGRIVSKTFWYNVGDMTFDIEGDKQEQEALKQLRLGEIYEQNDQPKEAVDAYTKGLNSPSSLTRARAYDGISRSAHMQMSWWNKYLFTRLGRSLSFTESWLLTIFLALMLISVVVLLTRRSRRNKLGLEPFADSTEHKQAASFEAILKIKLDELRKSQQAGAQNRLLGRLPIYTKTRGKALAFIDVPTLWDSSFVDLAAKSLPDSYGVFAAAFLKIFDKPKYLIQGAFQADGASGMYVIVSLKIFGRLSRVWEEELTVTGLAAQQRDLANGIVIYLREYLINEHASQY